MDEKLLIKKAKEARENSYSPYSNFAVGAALLTEEGKIFTGCNVENAVYGLSNCAERTAIFKAVSEGYRRFTAIAVVADTDEVCKPCGSCRQVFIEFNPDMEVIMSNLNGDVEIKKAVQLLPGSFSRKQLNG